MPGKYLLNCFDVKFSADEVLVLEQPWTDDTDLKELRRNLGENWFIIRRGNLIYGLPLALESDEKFGAKQTLLSLSTYEGLDFMRARLNEALPALLPKYDAQGIRPFRFVAKKDEFVHGYSCDNYLPEIVKNGFSIRPKFELEARTLELFEGELKVVVTMSVAMQWSISADISELEGQGVSLEGLYVLRKDPKPGERRLAGRIKRIDSGRVDLDESGDGESTLPCELLRLEGSKHSFKRCLYRLLGSKYRSFEAQRDQWETRFTSGPSLDDILKRFSEKERTIPLGPKISATVGSVIAVQNTSEASIFRELGAVDYCFDAAKTKRNTIPWEGLLEHGPYDSDTFQNRTPRILVVVPQTEQHKAEQVLGMFLDGIPNGAYPVGFARLFNLRQVKFSTCPVPDQRLVGEQYAQAYRNSIEEFLSSGSVSYDAAFVVVPDISLQLPDRSNPYLHAKALLLTNGIPSQELRVTTLHQEERPLQYVLRNIAVSLYAKMGGTPWTVSQPRTYNDEIVIGMGMAEVAGSRLEKRQRHMGITTVFLGDGNFLLSNISRECSYDEYPEVLKASTKAVLAEVKRRNGWEPGDRVRIVFHSSKPLKNVEIDELIAECVAEVAGEQFVEFASLQVSQDHSFKVIDRFQDGVKFGKAMKGKFVPRRGFVMQLGANTRLLATNGPVQIKRSLSPLPAPLLVHLHKRSTSKSLDALTEQILKFTSMTWRSTTPAAMPVTIYYSELIAELLARFKSLPDWSPALLNTKLRASKWFL